jgi:DNA mismatch repair protein MutS
MSSILDEYEAVLQEYQVKFGDRTVLLFEVGSFFELYSADAEASEFDIHHVCDLLNIQVTRRNKNVAEVSRANYLMAGFPSYCIDKFTKVLVDNNFTTVVVTQTTPPPKPKRAVTRVLSPGVNLDASTDWNYMMCMYFYEAKHEIGVAVAYMDVGTGESFVLEIAPSRSISDDINRVLISTAPKEVYIVGSGISEPSALLKSLDLSNMYVHNCINANEHDFHNVHFQNQFLKKVFDNTGMLQPLEYLNIERHPLISCAYVAMLAFVGNHSGELLKKISKPMHVIDTNTLILSATAAVQLDVMTGANRRCPSLLSTLNRCKTAIGRRAFINSVLNASTCVSDIEEQYDIQDSLIASKAFVTVRNCLSGTIDIKKVVHKMDIGLAKLYDVMCLAKALSKFEMITVDVKGMHKFMKLVKACKTSIEESIDIVDAQKKQHVFVSGKHADLDRMLEEAAQIDEKMNAYVSMYNVLAGSEIFRMDTNERDGAHMIVTIKRFKGFEMGHGEAAHDLTTKRVSPTSASYKVFHSELTACHERLIALTDKITKTTELHFARFVAEFVDTHKQHLEDIIMMVGKLDIWSNNAANAVEFYYARPKIEGNSPFVEAKQLRHPLVERIQQNEMYVPNDVVLRENGMLLYGVNASGKSCYMKSVGLAIIMACSGMYVPCSKMSFYPYKKIFTRIPSGDDISRGRSTFTNEVVELRNIISNACGKSLVIGDELCSGTENISAMSIVAAGIVALSRSKTAFVFASHLHGIVQICEVQELVDAGALNVFHMGVTYNDKDKRLVYGRKIQPGVGSTVYGLEVCRALDMDPSFIMLANNIRERILGTPMVPRKKTRYNARLYKDVCTMCGGKGDDVHHIIERHTAGKNGRIEHFHMNALHNLQNVCKKCHKNMHHM